MNWWRRTALRVYELRRSKEMVVRRLRSCLGISWSIN